MSYDNLCDNDLGIVVVLIVSEKVKIILTNFCEKGYWPSVLYTTFNNISVISLVEKTGVPAENHRPDANHWQTLSHVVSSTPVWVEFELTMLACGDRHWLHR